MGHHETVSVNDIAGVARISARYRGLPNLAKVEVASSNLVSRSK